MLSSDELNKATEDLNSITRLLKSARTAKTEITNNWDNVQNRLNNSPELQNYFIDTTDGKKSGFTTAMESFQKDGYKSEFEGMCRKLDEITKGIDYRSDPHIIDPIKHTITTLEKEIPTLEDEIKTRETNIASQVNMEEMGKLENELKTKKAKAEAQATADKANQATEEQAKAAAAKSKAAIKTAGKSIGDQLTRHTGNGPKQGN